MPWRRKPVSWLEYWQGPVNRDARFKTVLIYCVGPPNGKLCGHCGSIPLKDLADWQWQEISPHLRCTACGTVGYVDTRNNWSEVINFSKGAG
jgi:hypothetical protein